MSSEAPRASFAGGGGRSADQAVPPLALTDTHCHLDMLKLDVERALSEAATAGVRTVLTVGIDGPSSRQAVALAERFPDVYAVVGLHPHEASTYDAALASELERLAGGAKVVAIGECGLDYYRDASPRDDQRRAFVAQMDLARRLSLPLVVHTREASADTFRLLDEFGGDLRVVMHCFSAPEWVEECNRRGYFVSFAGNLTFKNAASLREAALQVRAELLLVETDAPFLAPVPHRGKDNVPAWVTLTAALLGDLRGWDRSTVAALTTANARRAFALPDPERVTEAARP